MRKDSKLMEMFILTGEEELKCLIEVYYHLERSYLLINTSLTSYFSHLQISNLLSDISQTSCFSIKEFLHINPIDFIKFNAIFPRSVQRLK